MAQFSLLAMFGLLLLLSALALPEASSCNFPHIYNNSFLPTVTGMDMSLLYVPGARNPGRTFIIPFCWEL